MGQYRWGLTQRVGSYRTRQQLYRAGGARKGSSPKKQDNGALRGGLKRGYKGAKGDAAPRVYVSTSTALPVPLRALCGPRALWVTIRG